MFDIHLSGAFLKRASTERGAVSNGSCPKINLPVLLPAGQWQSGPYICWPSGYNWVKSLGQIIHHHMCFFSGSRGFHEGTLGYASDTSMYKWLINIWEDQGQDRHQVLSQSPLLTLVPFQLL